MLITLRNSGAKGIQYTRVIDDSLKLEMLLLVEKSDKNSFLEKLYHSFLEETELNAFIIDSTIIPTVLHLVVKEHSWNGDKNLMYEIHLEVNKSHYRLYYESNVKPDFFKKLFTIFYPEMANNQVEELI